MATRPGSPAEISPDLVSLRASSTGSEGREMTDGACRWCREMGIQHLSCRGGRGRGRRAASGSLPFEHTTGGFVRIRRRGWNLLDMVGKDKPRRRMVQRGRGVSHGAHP